MTAKGETLVDLRAPVTIQQRWRLYHLFPVFASLAFECLVRVGHGVFLEREQLSQGIE
jgi:hypothetical protein